VRQNRAISIALSELSRIPKPIQGLRAFALHPWLPCSAPAVLRAFPAALTVFPAALTAFPAALTVFPAALTVFPAALTVFPAALTLFLRRSPCSLQRSPCSCGAHRVPCGAHRVRCGAHLLPAALTLFRTWRAKFILRANRKGLPVITERPLARLTLVTYSLRLVGSLCRGGAVVTF
jgi:hypothetical protein